MGSIRTWEDLTKKFLDKYFSVFEAWERFKEIVRKCQHNGIELWMQLQDFCDGLTPPSRQTLNIAVGGPLMKKTPEDIVAILDELSEDANQWPAESNDRRKLVGVHQVEYNTAMQAQLDAMAKEIRKLTLDKVQSQPSPVCDFCGMVHSTHECQALAADEVVNTVESFDRGNYQMGNNFNSTGQRHLGFSWNSPSGSLNSWRRNNSIPQGQGAPGFQNQQKQQYQPPQSNQSSMEDLMKAFIIKTNKRLDTHDAAIKELGTTFQNLEIQVGKLANLLSERVLGTLSADSERNPKETINAVSLRSGNVLEDPKAKQA
ncbi:PREDICTED: uncharacterized protein LOC109238594 [Nicotiana attenuata]|uniref:uncharacterized protein LOC109238594 n=1 Tax=Nicotiana attenuata TaxID=49451 RepID=UPI0009055EF4|nr:PREDICTED: uncharacterized protein LOC109238594 [Nicotiana attenuata]